MIVVLQNTSLFGALFPGLDVARESALAYGNGFVVVDAADHQQVEGSDELRMKYRHFSPNPEAFERWCCHRWLLLRHWMAKENVAECFVADSDVLFFANMEDIKPTFGTLTLASEPTGSCYMTRAGADAICQHILDAFRSPDPRVFSEDRRNICDYLILDHWLRSLNQPICGGMLSPWMIDPNFTILFGTKGRNGHRDIYFQNGIPHWIYGETVVKQATIHCWGPGKTKLARIWRQSRESIETGEPVRLTL